MTGPMERGGRSYRFIPREENHVSAVMHAHPLPLYWSAWISLAWDYPIHFMRARCLTQHCTTQPSTGRGRTAFSPTQRCGHCSHGTERPENLLSIFFLRHLTLTMWLLLTDAENNYAVLDFSFRPNSSISCILCSSQNAL